MNQAKNKRELQAQYADCIEEFQQQKQIWKNKLGWRECAPLTTRYRNPVFIVNLDEPDKHNNRFIEIDHNWWFLQNGAQILSIPLLLLGGSFLYLSLYTLALKDFDWFNFLFTLVIGLLFTGSWFYMVHKGIRRSSVVRYNRQAQLVHLWYKDKFVSYPWKEVAAYHKVVPANVMFSNWLMLHFPGNKTVYGNCKPILLHRASFSPFDYGFASDQLSRWESIRRYMEEGLESIAPNVPESELRKGAKVFNYKQQRFIDMSPYSLLYWGFYIFCAGWYIDWIMDKHRQNFKWPDDIEAVCAADAKEKGLLDGFDTEPVKAIDERDIVEKY